MAARQGGPRRPWVSRPARCPATAGFGGVGLLRLAAGEANDMGLRTANLRGRAMRRPPVPADRSVTAFGPFDGEHCPLHRMPLRSDHSRGIHSPLHRTGTVLAAFRRGRRAGPCTCVRHYTPPPRFPQGCPRKIIRGRRLCRFVRNGVGPRSSWHGSCPDARVRARGRRDPATQAVGPRGRKTGRDDRGRSGPPAASDGSEPRANATRRSAARRT